MNQNKLRQYLGEKQDERDYTLIHQTQRDTTEVKVNVYVTKNALQIVAGDYVVTIRAAGYETVKINAQVIKATPYNIVGTE